MHAVGVENEKDGILEDAVEEMVSELGGDKDESDDEDEVEESMMDLGC